MLFHSRHLLAFARHSGLTLIVFTAFLGVAVGQEPVTLRPGIVVDPTGKTIYAMTPDGITALDLSSGSKRWTTSEAAKPLAVSGNVLISQIEPKSRTSILELATLNTSNRGSLIARSTKPLPDTVRVTIGQTLDGNFETEAHMLAKDALVTWRFERRPLQGRRSMGEREPSIESTSNQEVTETMAAVAKAAPAGLNVARRASTEGAFRVDLMSGQASFADAGPSIRAAQQLRIPSEQRISAAPPVQFESSDKRHVMASERINDNNTWAKYRWIVYERESGRRIGEFRTHLAFAPFVVKDAILIYESTPFTKDGKEEPAKLRGINLTTGQEVWNIEVRENAFRGPFPP